MAAQQNSAKVKVLFLCMGNICRSPTAEGVFRQVIAEKGLEEHFYIDSAGTHSYHVGEAPDPRSVKAALQAGIDISHLRARQLKPQDSREFDYILAMDNDNLQLARALLSGKRNQSAAKDASDDATLALFLSYTSGMMGDEVPDPYYGGKDGFQEVIALVQKASRGFLDHLRDKGSID